MLLKDEVSVLQGAKQMGLKKYLAKSFKEKAYGSANLVKKLYVMGIIDAADWVTAILSFCLPLLYIIGTYKKAESAIVMVFEFGICVTLIADFFFRMYISENKLQFLMKPQSIIDYMSIIPTLVRDILRSKNPVLKYIKVLRIVSCMRLESFFSRKNYIILKRVFNIVFIVLALLMINGGAILEIENYYYIKNSNVDYAKVKQKFLQFHDIIYFSIVTIGTLGYGDIVPQNTISKAIVYFEIIMVLVLLPPSMNNLFNALNQKSRYQMQVYEKRDERHIVLLGYFSAQALQTFLEELYHSDHGCNNFITVILRPDPPSSEILLLIRQSQYISKCVYIQGNPLEEESLKRARAHAAICVIIITKKVYNELAVEEDYTIMQWILSIKSFCKKTKSRQVRVCIQVNSPVSKRMFKFISNYKQSCIDQVICTEELKLKLIAKNCTCPGIITIIASLLTSSIPSIEEPFPNELCDSNKHFAVLSGMQCEIYRVTLKSEVFGGYYFKDLITVLYTQRKVILFALEVDVGQVRKVFVNPADFMLEYKDYYAYLIDVKMPNIANINNVSMSENIKRFDYSIANKSSTSLQYKNIKVEKALPTNQEMIANIKQNYYTYKTHIDYDKIELFDVAEKNIKMHIILCGYISQIEVFISTLRSKILGNKVPAIVILTNDKNIISQWEKIRIYEDIYVVRGSALNVADLDRAGIRTAKVVVILPKKEIYESKNKLGEESETIFIYNTIKNLTQKVRIITEIKEASNISYLLGITEEKNLRKYGYWTTDPLANGELYLSYFLDTLICQSFYNPFIEHIIEQFVLGSSNTTHDEQQIHNSAGLSECALFLFNPLPEHKNSLTYGEIFELLVRKYKMISIGLFKRIDRHSNPIVLIHPPSDIKVNHYDKIFVLYRNEPTMFYDEAKESMDHLGGKTLFDKIKLKKSSNKGLNQAALSSLSQGINLLRNKVKQLHAAIPKI